MVNGNLQHRLLSAKPPLQPIQKTVEGQQPKKPKTQPEPKITLISSDDNISITTLAEAQTISKRRDLKLVKILDIDNKTQRPVYRLMTGSEYHKEELNQRKNKANKVVSALKGEKLLMINSQISKHDLEVYVNKILKWITKRYEVRVSISGSEANTEKSEYIYKFLEDNLKNDSRFLQKRVKGNDLRFQIIPPKEKEDPPPTA
ncbi:hypothetical protein RN001_003491 [Aquatica leii]|uniref:Translation initiation factor 3 N-terminal domain-containing protein n=1 Tax=Aquatica leii TaxID=1421715 RepID=A0AAN7ST14_9COLE|nr:hypothetical protein RN001_003491 [Aquatica leii]